MCFGSERRGSIRSQSCGYCLAVLSKVVRKFFCKNQDCSHKTFSERFDFVAPNQKKTNRLLQKILFTSTLPYESQKNINCKIFFCTNDNTLLIYYNILNPSKYYMLLKLKLKSHPFFAPYMSR